MSEPDTSNQNIFGEEPEKVVDDIDEDGNIKCPVCGNFNDPESPERCELCHKAFCPEHMECIDQEENCWACPKCVKDLQKSEEATTEGDE